MPLSCTVTWYSPLEMAKRIAFYHSCQPIGSMMAGALQAAIYKQLNGHLGLAGWRWTFIINGTYRPLEWTALSLPCRNHNRLRRRHRLLHDPGLSRQSQVRIA